MTVTQLRAYICEVLSWIDILGLSDKLRPLTGSHNTPNHPRIPFRDINLHSIHLIT